MAKLLKVPLYEREYFAPRYRLRWDTWYKMFTNPYRTWKVRRERVKYGVARYDAWNFHDYLDKVLANGLIELAQNKSGIPMQFVSEPGKLTDEDVASWDKVIWQMAEDAHWLATFEEKEDAVHDKYYTEEDGFDMVPSEDGKYFRMVEKRNLPERDANWREATKELDAERQMRKDRLMDMVKEHYFTLWD